MIYENNILITCLILIKIFRFYRWKWVYWLICIVMDSLCWRKLILPYLWGKADFSLKNWLKSPGLGSHPRLKGNQILKVAF